MTLESQVVSLELAKRLKELGVKQESLFYWRGVSNNTAPEPENWYYSWRVVDNLETVPSHSNNARLRQYSAHTVAELGEMLKGEAMPFWNERLQKWEYELVKGAWISCDTEADARAKVLIYLIENKLITV